MVRGDKLIVINDCMCEHYLHELTKYPRPGLVERRLLKGEEVEFIERWSNFYGTYYCVKKDETYDYDILPENLKIK